VQGEAITVADTVGTQVCLPHPLRIRGRKFRHNGDTARQLP